MAATSDIHSLTNHGRDIFFGCMFLNEGYAHAHYIVCSAQCAHAKMIVRTLNHPGRVWTRTTSLRRSFRVNSWPGRRLKSQGNKPGQWRRYEFLFKPSSNNKRDASSVGTDEVHDRCVGRAGLLAGSLVKAARRWMALVARLGSGCCDVIVVLSSLDAPSTS